MDEGSWPGGSDGPIGNIFGIWETPENKDQAPLMIGSHIDTVINAGQFDGCLGVISSIEVIKH